MTEQSTWELIRRNVRGPHWSRIENRAGTGECDVNGCWNGREVWIELKVLRGNVMVFQQSEVAWIMAHSLRAGRCWVLARKQTKKQDSLYLFEGAKMDRLVRAGIIKVDQQRAGEAATIAPGVVDSLAHTVLHGPFNWDLFKKVVFDVR